MCNNHKRKYKMNDNNTIYVTKEINTYLVQVYIDWPKGSYQIRHTNVQLDRDVVIVGTIEARYDHQGNAHCLLGSNHLHWDTPSTRSAAICSISRYVVLFRRCPTRTKGPI